MLFRSPFRRLISSSKWYCIAEGSQITLSNGDLKPIENIVPGDVVKTFESFGKDVLHRFDNGVQDCLELVLEDGKILTATGDHEVQCLSEDGNSLIWKKMSDLTLEDMVVTD